MQPQRVPERGGPAVPLSQAASPAPHSPQDEAPCLGQAASIPGPSPLCPPHCILWACHSWATHPCSHTLTRTDLCHSSPHPHLHATSALSAPHLLGLLTLTVTPGETPTAVFFGGDGVTFVALGWVPARPQIPLGSVFAEELGYSGVRAAWGPRPAPA